MLGTIHKTQPVAKLAKFRFTIDVRDSVTKEYLLKGFILDAEIEAQFRSKTTRAYVAKHKLKNLWRDQLRTGFETYQWLKTWFSEDTETFLHDFIVNEIKEI